jgi:glucose-6-phosphate dehydrogenase assembly protein OpcA
VLDTEYTSIASLLSLAKWAKAYEKATVADLAWTRIAVWQEMCARFFDDPKMLPLAYGVDSLRIVQMSQPGERLGSEGSLMLGWLVSRLGWRSEQMGGSLQFRRKDGKAVDVELSSMPRPPNVAPLAIASITMTMSAGGVAAAGTIARDFEGDVEDVLRYKLDANVPASGEQTVRLGANKGARVLERTLHRPMHDPTFDAAVAFAEQLADDVTTVT